MMLLGMVAVGILAVAASQNRIAAQTVLVAQARQQALIGLDAAIAELQVHVGPDQRVTASSGILDDGDSHSQHILGVWNSWQVPLYAQMNGRRISSTYSDGRRNMFRTWLISSREPVNLRQIESISNLGSRRPGLRILLVGEGTMGRNADNRQFVYADLVAMPSAGKNEACFAWWVGGQNQKANVSFRDREATTDPVETLHRTWDTPGPIFENTESLAFVRGRGAITDPAKILTLKTLPLSVHSSHEAGTPYFFDVTPYSFSLATDVRDGGLKFDLNLLLNKKSLSGTPYAARPGQDAPLAEGESVPTGVEPSMPIGSWQIMHAYHNTWPDGTGSDNDLSARLVGTVNHAYSRISGNLVQKTTSKGDRVTIFDAHALEGNAQAGYPRTPVLTTFLGAYGLVVSDPGPGGGRSHGYAYAPFITWWNPYNVPMRVKGKKLWSMSLPYRLTSILSWSDFPVGQGGRWRRDMLMQAHETSGDLGQQFDRASSGQGNCLGDDWGNYFINAENDEDGDIIFAPGELLVFSMARGWNNLREALKSGVDKSIPIGQPHAVPFVLGDNMGDLHFYSASQFSYGDRSDIAVSYAFEARQIYNNEQNAESSRFTMQTRMDSVDGEYSNNTYLFDTAGEVFGPHAREAFVVPHGFDGIDASEYKRRPLRESRLSSKPDRFINAGGISPNHFNLGWYDRDQVSENGMGMVFIREAYWHTSMAKDAPDYYAAVGIVPKGFNASFNEGFPMFRGKDYRTKVWQHSNPALGSSALHRPDDQQRQYNPFQLAAVEMGSGVDRGALDTPNNRNGVWGISSAGSGGGESVSFIATHELPLHPPYSLAGFAGMRLNPGWYQTRDDNMSLATMRRMQYQAGVPGVGIGNSFADPCLPADDVHTIHSSNVVTDLPSNGSIFTDFFDHALIINDALWDQWFCSSMSDMPMAGGKREVRELVENFVNGDEPLPVSRYKRGPSPVNKKEIIRRLLADDGWMRVARYLIIEGGFNVNSVSVDAWAATLQGLAKRELVTNADGSLALVRKDDDGVLFSRFMVSTAAESIDGRGYNVVNGSGDLRPGLKMASAWGEIRQLDASDIRRLAEEIVKKVRERGPFLNMSDFINRRLDGGSATALTGALQAAIDATDINRVFHDSSYNVSPVTGGSLYSYPRAEEGSMYTAAPGYLIQSDVLASLGNILTVRDDTFVVRAYGCVRNARKVILAQAWCEALVQRTIEYVDPSNAPDVGPTTITRRRRPQGLSEINKVMGRHFRVVSFKWLDIWDI